MAAAAALRERHNHGGGYIEMRTYSESSEKRVILPYKKETEVFLLPVEAEQRLGYLLCKRTLDIVISVAALILLLIPMIGIAILIKCTSPGTVFFCQERLGLYGKQIRIRKFRSMYMTAEENGAQWSVGCDPRVTPIGRILRRYHLDELPQFWNIFCGDLSLVGPRPERECFYREFETYIHGFSERLKVKPGLTGLAQIRGGCDLRPEEKILYDLEYIRTRSLRKDLEILLRTVPVVLRGTKARKIEKEFRG